MRRLVCSEAPSRSAELAPWGNSFKMENMGRQVKYLLGGAWLTEFNGTCRVVASIFEVMG